MNETVVFLPGMMCDARLFLPQILSLGATRPIGFMPLTGASSMGALASSVLDAAPRRFALVGHGMGGMVAMEVLRRAPERVTRIALMDTSPQPEPPSVAGQREPRIIAVQTGKMADAMKAEVPPECLAPGTGRREIQALLTDMAETLGRDVFIAQSRALQRRPDQQKTLSATKVPALVLCGEHDTLYPVARHAFMADLIPVAELRVVSGAGHLPTVEQPEETTEILRTWLEAPLLVR
jgi:pimeloyl-ACP methyl ester carboxylesterase